MLRDPPIDPSDVTRQYRDDMARLQFDVQKCYQCPPTKGITGKAFIEKNRYDDIIPWKHSVVMRIPGVRAHNTSKDSYINANHVFLHGEHFILTQAPTQFAVTDFWQMIWEQRVGVICMLTRLMEGTIVKADRYWPNPGKLLNLKLPYGRLIVRNIQTVTINPYLVRNEFFLAMVSEAGGLAPGYPSHRVFQFCASHWPDNGVPESASETVEIIEHSWETLKTLEAETTGYVSAQQKAIDALRPTKSRFETPKPSTETRTTLKGFDKLPSSPLELLPSIPLPDQPFSIPTVVHCSAGVGRSATFVILWLCLRTLDKYMTKDYSHFDEPLTRLGLVRDLSDLDRLLPPSRCEYVPLVSTMFPIYDLVIALRNIRSPFVCEPPCQFEFIHFSLDWYWKQRRLNALDSGGELLALTEGFGDEGPDIYPKESEDEDDEAPAE